LHEKKLKPALPQKELHGDLGLLGGGVA